MRLLKLHRSVESAGSTFYDNIYGPSEGRATRVSHGDIASAWAALLLVGASFFTMLAS